MRAQQNELPPCVSGVFRASWPIWGPECLRGQEDKQSRVLGQVEGALLGKEEAGANQAAS